MKVTINRKGYLILRPENELDSYALRQWVKENTLKDTTKILVHTLTEEEESKGT